MQENMEVNKTQQGNKARKIKLYCPTLPKLAQVTAWEDQKLDLGTIARIFGLEPATLKLNGHFISRGVDLVASSVTWKSLFSFFSSKGLGTGVDGSSALIVDGKLTKSGAKRGHVSAEVDQEGLQSAKQLGRSMEMKQEDIYSTNNYKRLKESNNGYQGATYSNSGVKRKYWLDNISPFKKLRIHGSYSDENSQGLQQKANKRSCTELPHEEPVNKRSCTSALNCGYLLRENMKRMREDEVLVTTCKRTR